MLSVTRAENAFTEIWFVGCALGGLLFLVFGPRALGLGLWGSLVGGFVGLMAVSSNFDTLPTGAALGASIGLFVGGLLGLASRPKLPAPVAGLLAYAAALGGATVWMLIHLGATISCRASLCFPNWTPLWNPYLQPLLAVDAAFVVLLCAREAWRARSHELVATGTSATIASGPLDPRSETEARH